MTIPPTRLGIFLWANDISPTMLAKELGINQSYLSQIIWGKRSSRETCELIANYLGISIDLIFEGLLKRGRPPKNE